MAAKSNKAGNVVSLPNAKASAAKQTTAKASEKKPAAKKKDDPFTATVIMKMRKDTKGAFVYEAVDDKGRSILQDDTAMPSVYLRKAKVPAGLEFLEITIKAVPGLTAKPKAGKPEADEGEDD